jgi:hypothetical protein
LDQLEYLLTKNCVRGYGSQVNKQMVLAGEVYLFWFGLKVAIISLPFPFCKWREKSTTCVCVKVYYNCARVAHRDADNDNDDIVQGKGRQSEEFQGQRCVCMLLLSLLIFARDKPIPS